MNSAKQFEQFRPEADEDSVKLLFENLFLEESQSYRILDFGSGSGALTHKMFSPLMEKLDVKVTGVDVSANMITYAQESYSHPSIQYICGDILSVDENNLVDKYSFDFIFSFYVFHWLSDLKWNAFKIFSELLKPGGEIRFTMTADTVIDEMLEWVTNHTNWNHLAKGNSRPFPKWKLQNQNSIEYLTPIISSLGFEIVYLEEKAVLNSYKPLTNLTDFYLSFLPNQLGYENLGPLEKSSFYQEISKFLVSHNKVSIKKEENIATEETKVLIGILRKRNDNSSE